MIPHPDAASLTLDAVVQALADRQRRAILAEIRAAGQITCSAVAPDLPRSTVSVHLKRLREAGLIQQARLGQLIENRFRKDGAAARFPDLLAAISRYDSGAE